MTNSAKLLTANRLSDGIAVWFTQDGTWAELIEDGFVATSAQKVELLQDALDAALKGTDVVDIALIDMAETSEGWQPQRLRERIRAAGPTIRLDLGKQAEIAASLAA